MRFIEILPGESLSVDCIQYFCKQEDGSTFIYTKDGVELETVISYEIFQELVKERQVSALDQNQTLYAMQKSLDQIAKYQQVFRP